MKRIIPVLLLSALMLTACNGGKSSSNGETPSETATSAAAATADTAASTTELTSTVKAETTTTSATTVTDKYDLSVTTTATTKQNNSNAETANGDSPELPAFGDETDNKPSTNTTQAAAQSAEKAAEGNADTEIAETLPVNEEPIELPIIPIS